MPMKTIASNLSKHLRKVAPTSSVHWFRFSSAEKFTESTEPPCWPTVLAFRTPHVSGDWKISTGEQHRGGGTKTESNILNIMKIIWGCFQLKKPVQCSVIQSTELFHCIYCQKIPPDTLRRKRYFLMLQMLHLFVPLHSMQTFWDQISTVTIILTLSKPQFLSPVLWHLLLLFQRISCQSWTCSCSNSSFVSAEQLINL